ncbi:MAG: dehydrogenase [uncultured archaeon A07HN63]|nr:MAG: dehydrogenase [uncultured archaeon A07HN63]
MANSPEEIAGVGDVDCTGQQVLVTGSTSGIGRAAALAFGRLGADVIVHGRDGAAGAAVVDEIEAVGASATFIEADFADLDAVAELAATVRTDTAGLDFLVNNAGGLFREGRLTDAGIEYTFHVNHLAPFLLTAELVDHLNDDARIVTTASAAHQGASLDLDRVEDVESYSGTWAYSHSKLANILFTIELANRLDRADRAVTANCVHPGAIPGSGFVRFLPGPLSRLANALDVVPGVTSVADGAAELLFAALSPRVADVSGRYFAGQSAGTPSAAANDADAARRLWAYSADVLDRPEPLAEALAQQSD